MFKSTFNKSFITMTLPSVVKICGVEIYKLHIYYYYYIFNNEVIY